MTANPDVQVRPRGGGLLAALKRIDQRRPSLPGEHWAALGAGTALLGYARRRHSPLLRLAALVAGGVLVYRAASGRDGVAKLLR
jgi:uncharacterized membrane protein